MVLPLIIRYLPIDLLFCDTPSQAIRKLRGMRLDPTVTKRTTHLVSLEPRRTLNLLRGLMRGVWIVSYKWVLESIRVGKWVNEEKYELTSFSRAVEVSWPNIFIKN